MAANLDVVINDKTEEGTQSVVRNLQKINYNAVIMTKGIAEDEKALSALKAMMKNLSSETELASTELKKLSGSANFTSLEKARTASNALKELKATVDSLSGGYGEAKQMFKKFMDEFGGTGIYKTKAMQNVLKGLDGDIKKVGSSLTSTSVGIENAMSRAEARIQKLSSGGLNSLYASIKRIAAAYLSWQSVKTLFSTIIDQTTQQEQASAQLEARLKSTKYAAGLSAEQLQSMSERLRDITTYSDEAILSGENMLLTFKNVKGDQFEQATKAALNMSTAFGGDLQSSILRVGKALQDPIKGVTSLRRVGVQLSATQVEQVKNFMKVNDVASAQNIILKELNSEFGNSATAARSTLGGALAALKNKFLDLFEADPKTEFNGVTTSINKLADALDKPNVKKLRDDLMDLASNALTKVADGLTNVTDLLGSLKNIARTGITIGIGFKIGGLLGGPLGAGLGAASGGVLSSIADFIEKEFKGAKSNRNMIATLKSGGIDYMSAGSKSGKTLQQQYDEYMKNLSGKNADQLTRNSILQAGTSGQYANLKASGYEIATGAGGKAKKSGSSSKSSGPSATEQLVSSIQDQMKYMYADGESFLPVLDKWLAKLKPLSKEWKTVKDLQLSITDAAEKKNPLSGENYAKSLKEQQERLKSYKAQAEQVNSEYYGNLSWQNSSGLMSNGDYVAKLTERFESLKDAMKSSGLDAENYLQWPTELRDAFSQLQSAVGNEMSPALEKLNEQYNNGILTQGEYKTSLENLMAQYAKYPTITKEIQKNIDAVNKTQLSFGNNLRSMLSDATKNFDNLSTTITTGLVDGFAKAIAYGDNLGDTLKKLGQDIIYTVTKMLLLQTITSALGLGGASVDYSGGGEWVPLSAVNANGNIFSGAGISAYSNSIVSEPTIFPFAKGIGLMGEAGSEAVMPLKRTSSGNLGVEVADGATSGGFTSNTTMTINVNNTGSGDMSDKQAKEMGKTLKDTIDIRIAEKFSEYQRTGAFRNAYAR